MMKFRIPNSTFRIFLLVAVLLSSGSWLLSSALAQFIPSQGPWIDTKNYGTWTAAQNAANTAGRGIMLSTQLSLSTATTITVPLTGVKGGLLTLSSAVTVTLPASFTAGRYQVLSAGTGTFRFAAGMSEVYPEWFGTGCAAIDKAVLSLERTGGVVSLATGTYTCDTSSTRASGGVLYYIVASSGVNIIGAGEDATVLYVASGQSASAWNVIGTNAGAVSNATYRGFTVDGNGDNNYTPVGGTETGYYNSAVGLRKGGTNIDIGPLTVRNMPGTSPVIISRYTDTANPELYGNNRVHDVKFSNMGMEISGNGITDITAIYLEGRDNKIFNNKWIADVRINGAFIEVHGANAEVYGNHVSNVDVGMSLVNAEEALGATFIHDNRFKDIWEGPFVYATLSGGFSLGTVRIYDNYVTSHASATSTDEFISGPDAGGNATVDRFEFIGNTVVHQGSNLQAAIKTPGYKKAIIKGNTFDGFQYGVLASNAALLGDAYTNHELDISGNKFKNISLYTIYAPSGTNIKDLTIKNNDAHADSGSGLLFTILSGTVDTGLMSGNSVNSQYTYDYGGTSTAVSIKVDHVSGAASGPFDPTNAACAVGSRFHSGALTYVKTGTGKTSSDYITMPHLGDTVITEQTYSLASTEGTSTFASRADHSHGTPNFPALDEILNPGASKTFTMANKTLSFNYTAPTALGFEIEAIGGFTGDLLHVHQHTGNPGAGTDLLHLEATDSDVTALRIIHSASTYPAIESIGSISVTGNMTLNGTFSATTVSGIVGDTVVTEQTYSLASTAGTSTFASRADHSHGTPRDTVTFFQSTPSTSVTGTTRETVLYSRSIEGGSIGPNGTLSFTVYSSQTNNANIKWVSVYLGGQLIGQVNAVSAAGYRFTSDMINTGAENAQLYQINVAGFGAITPLTSAINTAATNTFEVRSTLTNAADSLTLLYVGGTIKRGD